MADQLQMLDTELDFVVCSNLLRHTIQMTFSEGKMVICQRNQQHK